MGKPNSFISYGPQWAEAGSAPFMRRKGYTREGGITAPMIIAGPGVEAAALIDRSYLTVMDLAPTFLEIADAVYPADGSVRPMLGKSMRALLAGETESVHGDDYVTTLYHSGRAFLRQGDWKIANLEAPFSEDDFELFNLADDPGETINLADSHPEKYEELITLWRKERVRLGIVLPQDL